MATAGGERKAKPGPRPAIDVELSFKVVRVHAVDSSTGSVTLDFLLIANWTDPRLAGCKPSEVDWERAFRPKLAVQNDIDLDKTYENLRLSNFETGKVALTMRFRGSVVQTFDLQHFPFDVQHLQLVIRCGQDITHARLIKHRTRRDTCEGFSVSEWSVGRMWADVGQSDPKVSGTGRIYSSYVVHVALRRKYQYFLWNYALIVLLLGTSALVSFTMAPSEMADRCSVNFTLVLTLTALKLCVADSLPNISYQTFMDKYVLAATMFLFAVIGENGLVKSMADEGRQARADMAGARLLVAAWVLLNTGFGLSAMRRAARQVSIAGERGCQQSPPKGSGVPVVAA